MKASMRVLSLVAAAGAVIFLFGCSAKATSIDDRILDFVTSLGGDRTDTYTNFDPSTAAYSTAKSPTFWDTSVFGTDKPYTYGTPNTSNPADVEFHIFDHSGTDLSNFQFIMVNIGTASDNWVISNIRVNPPGGALLF